MDLEFDGVTFIGELSKVATYPAHMDSVTSLCVDLVNNDMYMHPSLENKVV